MVLFRREGKGMDFRLGVVASKRVGGAPERARAKRRLREAFRRNRWRMERGQADVVAVARKGAVTAKWDDLEAEWLALLRKLGFRFREEEESHTEAQRHGEGGRAKAKGGEEG
jgi:ribonuclease P protein component